MKTKIFLFFLPFVIIACGPKTANPVSEKDKEIIKGEIKEVVNFIIKGCEEANFDMAMEPFLDSPDLVYIYNGVSFSYKGVVDGMGPRFDLLSSQKVTIIDEKYVFLDKSIVVYTTNCKFLENYKDGHATLSDPMVMQFTFMKINDKWKVINGVESSVRQDVKNSESSNGLNQVELLKKFAGNWEAPLGNDTIQVVQFKRLQGGNILSLYTKGVTKGKVLFEGTGFWGYNAVMNKIDLSVISGGYVFHYLGEFISPNKLELFDVNNATGNKFIFEIISPDEFKETTIANNKTETRIVKRVK